MIELFAMGGSLFMGILTLILVCLFLSAWKAPAWVKEIGLIALAFGVASQLLGIYQASAQLQECSDISGSLVAAGVKISLIPVLYGVFIYLISLILRIIQKPRI